MDDESLMFCNALLANPTNWDGLRDFLTEEYEGFSKEAMIAICQGYKSFGRETNCTLSTCPLDLTVLHYVPSLGWNTAFVVLYFLAMCVHIGLGIRWKTWWFMSFMLLGSVLEMVGYGGRLMLNENPFSYDGFLTQIILITVAPVFYSAAIYVTIAQLVRALNPAISRIAPRSYYWWFIASDVVSLVLQAVGGYWSTDSKGESKAAVDVSVAGLGLQVCTLAIFCFLVGDYMVRYFRWTPNGTVVSKRLKFFLSFISLAVLSILVRCIYRVVELRDGYFGDMVHNEPMFIGIEGVVVVVAVFALCIGHPGLLFKPPVQQDGEEVKEAENGSD